jgi:hypothetical protein
MNQALDGGMSYWIASDGLQGSLSPEIIDRACGGPSRCGILFLFVMSGLVVLFSSSSSFTRPNGRDLVLFGVNRDPGSVFFGLSRFSESFLCPEGRSVRNGFYVD